MNKDIRDLTLQELEAILEKWGEPGFRAPQVFSWIYKKGISDFDKMSDLPSGLRKRLRDSFSLLEPRLVRSFRSKDGTEKFLLELSDRNCIETVAIPTKRRITGCISTQVGCKFRCSFCASGRPGFRRSLTCAEIVAEVMFLKNNSQEKSLTHLVFMGTGEPLENYDSVLKAIRIINSRFGFNIGARRITISTAGVAPAIKRLMLEGLQIELSVSLHAADEKIRSFIMPINKVYPLKDLIAVCREYAKKTNRQITFEYILIKDINSGLQDALALSRILKGLNCKVNLIPVNPVGGCAFMPPEKQQILLFRDRLLNAGVHVTLRRARGEDIEAACGQLRLSCVGK